MMLIEPDKRWPEWAVNWPTPRARRASFSVPPNVYLLGLMNTADRSLAVLDFRCVGGSASSPAPASAEAVRRAPGAAG